jgi:hypothetical protein
MNLQALLAGLSLSSEFVAEITALLHLKAQAKEAGTGKRIALVDAYIADQISWATTVAKDDPDPALADDALALFRAIVKGEVK